MRPLSEGQRQLAIVIVLVTLAWMFRYETVGPNGVRHVNRFTGAICSVSEQCWFTNTN